MNAAPPQSCLFLPALPLPACPPVLRNASLPQLSRVPALLPTPTSTPCKHPTQDEGQCSANKRKKSLFAGTRFRPPSPPRGADDVGWCDIRRVANVKLSTPAAAAAAAKQICDGTGSKWVSHASLCIGAALMLHDGTGQFM